MKKKRFLSQIKISKDFFTVENKPQNNNWIIECVIHKVNVVDCGIRFCW
jgi:hypothetical protein